MQPGRVGLPEAGAPRPTRPGCGSADGHETASVVTTSEPSFARAAEKLFVLDASGQASSAVTFAAVGKLVERPDDRSQPEAA